MGTFQLGEKVLDWSHNSQRKASLLKNSFMGKVIVKIPLHIPVCRTVSPDHWDRSWKELSLKNRPLIVLAGDLGFISVLFHLGTKLAWFIYRMPSFYFLYVPPAQVIAKKKEGSGGKLESTLCFRTGPVFTTSPLARWALKCPFFKK